MRLFRIGFAWAVRYAAPLILLAAFLTGCETGGPAGGKTSTAMGPPPDVETLHIGDHVAIDFAGPDATALPKKIDLTAINDEGNILLPHIGAVRAAELTPRVLESTITTKYVPGWFKALTVTVTPLGRFFVVGGDVRNPNRYAYTSGMTVTKAIQTAGGFTEFASKTKVRLRRGNAAKDIIVNVRKATQNPEYDYPVYPGDLITVPRKVL
jgi:protein involved in polysaccharide export with SLBB domain